MGQRVSFVKCCCREENTSSTLLGTNIKSQYLCSKHINILKCQNLDKNLVYYHLDGIKKKNTTYL